MDQRLAEKLVSLAEKVRVILPGYSVTIVARDLDEFSGSHVLVSEDKLPQIIETLEDLQKEIGD